MDVKDHDLVNYNKRKIESPSVRVSIETLNGKTKSQYTVDSALFKVGINSKYIGGEEKLKSISFNNSRMIYKIQQQLESRMTYSLVNKQFITNKKKDLKVTIKDGYVVTSGTSTAIELVLVSDNK
ncbi:hypothetical protein [Metabacillus fastidiosus]|uniref:Uncharacterized protein n=1 Tax=Metabacillus fastidiosus TaxID=1458 RepID=A0ABU6NVN7_9BACI|nr:hypothetical protein [Metabacillus fastidiosus]